MIPDEAVDALTVVVALGSGIVAGVFFTFSTFVMTALAKLPPAQGIAAMQAINLAAVTPLFMLVLFGSGLGGIGLIVDAIPDLGEGAVALRLAGGLLYLLGPVGLTVTYHVPRNDRLASLEPNGPGAVDHWTQYVVQWTPMNHHRTVTALATATLLTVAHGIQ